MPTLDLLAAEYGPKYRPGTISWINSKLNHFGSNECTLSTIQNFKTETVDIISDYTYIVVYCG